ncbi:glucose PTS transporter subunit IIA [Spiroplasma clarkii]|uniref:PTS system, beta-glucoside-specific IIABC component n=1 Tax=Spiroplasma clarkii TaxID=2139 RepID=A0A2K8KL48_9MOLU|nr:PTS glucose transporter subunit IIABC [Spiroplasma clarkii]ATX71259.1 PTS system, beta-glucoside-specific IIABC component [Spiroplasma clarkii]
MSKKINVYAPCDGYVDKIQNIEDQTFADGLLGDGFFIKPESNKFYSPVKGKLTQIFNTKHAFYISSEGINILMHIGIDTVKLAGKPFQVVATEGSHVDQNGVLVEVDLTNISNQKIKTETPVVFQSQPGLKITWIKTGKVKQGDLICEVNFEVEDKTSNKTVMPVNFTGKYETVAMEINNFVGGKANYKKFYNCMTRLRIIIKDKNAVAIDKIKKISIVKGINWNGEELQIIIGGEVYKVREALEKYLDDLNNQQLNIRVNKSTTFSAKILAALGGIVTPILPILMGAGLLKALVSVLQISGAIQTIPSGTLAANLGAYDLFSVIMYLISDVGLLMIGFFFGYSTVRYLGGSTYVGGLVALTLVAPALFSGQFAFIYFTVLNVKVGIRGYTSSVVPQVGAAFIYFYFDKWVQKWMPKSVDIIFRPALSVLFTTLIVFMIVGPILGFFEAMVGNGVKYLETAPLGIGTAVYSGLRQMLVLTGLHTTVTSLIGAAGWYSGQSFNLMMAVSLAVFGQIGSGVGVVVRTKNSNIRAAAYGALPAAVFGITEPIIYGVNLPKVRPFFFGCLGAACAGLVAGIIGVNAYSGAGQGVLFFTGMFPTDDSTLTSAMLVKNVLGYVASMLVAILVPLGLVILFYKERVAELKGTKKLNNLVYKVLVKKFNFSKNQDLETLTLDLNKLTDCVSGENSKKIKKLDTLFNKKVKIQILITKVQSNEDKIKEKFATFANKNYVKGRQANVVKYNNLYHQVDFKKKYLQLNAELNNINQEMKELENWFNALQANYLKDVESILEKLNDRTNSKIFKPLVNNYFNVINSFPISYQMVEALPIEFKLNKK